ncbi:MAG: TonB-dependent receptor [Aureispira sp.]|nr:TonB-dependent receptor [Aureispira sp.]
MKTFYITIILLFIASFKVLGINDETQIIKGQVVDLYSKAPLEGATVELLNFRPIKQVITDEEGYFTMEEVPLGRHKLLVYKESFEDLVINGLEVTGGRQVVLKLNLEEAIIVTPLNDKVEKKEPKKKIEKIVKTTKDQPVNEMSLGSVRLFKVEEVSRFSGARFDPIRQMDAYAGLSTQDDYNNDINIRGNSPQQFQWKIEGIPIPNPNHLGKFGSTGGRFNILNPNVMADSDVYLGAFTAEYGNALSGVFDVKLHTGNKDRFQFMAQYSSATGAQAMIEGPLSKNRGGSFSTAFRYGLYNHGNGALERVLGNSYTPPKASPKYWDYTVKLDFPKTSIGTFSFFALGGFASEKLNGFDSILAAQSQNVNLYEQELNRSAVGILGLKHKTYIGKGRKGNIENVIGGTFTSVRQNTMWQEPGQEERLLNNLDNSLFTGSLLTTIRYKFNPKLILKGGYLSQIFSAKVDEAQNIDSPSEVSSNSQALTGLGRLHLQLMYRPTKSLMINGGFLSQYFHFSKSFTIAEPRLAINWSFLQNHSLYLSTGLYSQLLPWQVYLYKNKEGEYINRDLRQMRAFHINIGYNWVISKDWRLKLETYHQRFLSIPLDSTKEYHSLRNYGGPTQLIDYDNLTSDGTGINTGVEFTLEKFFSHGFYGLLTGAFYTSSHRKGDNEKLWRTPFGNGYRGNLLVGKEFLLGEKKINRLSLGLRVQYKAGNYITPVDSAASLVAQQTIYQEELGYSEKIKDYLRLDFRFGMIFNAPKGKMSHRLFIDVLNFINYKNVNGKYFDRSSQSVKYYYQMPLSIDVMYQFRF